MSAVNFVLPLFRLAEFLPKDQGCDWPSNS
jgi:hypothetical protein